MLFNSYEFIFLFLPIALCGYLLLRQFLGLPIATAYLTLASLFFYGWWKVEYLWLILASIAFNYGCGWCLSRVKARSIQRSALVLGIILNLGLLGYYKYANFFVENLELLTGLEVSFHKVILPIGISFFTFQQIAYLVDTYRGLTREYNFLNYTLFVTFFPQLIAGPIVHHKEMLPQFEKKQGSHSLRRDLSVGITIFLIGLFKKVVIADTMAGFSSPVFAAANAGQSLGFIDAWGGALAYTFQLYFDFSGYSDMAIGLGRMFGIRLPINFNSPYKAVSIVDFWRRWHITLSRFLRDYLYIPLGGNRYGPVRRYVNLMITMLLGGMWHGAAWAFVLWGALHGLFLVLTHAWHKFLYKFGLRSPKNYFYKCAGVILTFILVVIAWVPFRAETMVGTKNMYSTMFNLNTMEPNILSKLARAEVGFPDENELVHWNLFQRFPYTANEKYRYEIENMDFFRADFFILALYNLEVGGAYLIFLCLLICWFFPNTQEIMRRFEPGLDTYGDERSFASRHIFPLAWRPSVIWGLCIGLIGAVALLGLGSNLSEFLYFQF